MRNSRLAGLLFMAALALRVSAADLTPAQIAERATPSVVLIRVPDGLGSGFVVGADGRFVTNYHVIRGAKQATVVAADGHEYKDVELLAADIAHDLVLLRVSARNLTPLPLGDSASARPGQHVVAIGHPLGLGNTVSDGLVSAVREISKDLTLLQISAPISPGSSGGPVFNDRGEVIGISALVISSGQNLNFAIPIDAIKPLLKSDKGIPLAAWQPPQRRGRNIPDHPLSLLDDCPDTQLKTIVDNIDQAIHVGAPLYNEGNIEACYRIYAATALDAQKSVAACPGPKRALLDGVANADKLSGWDGKAWAMRDAFDGVLAVAEKKAGAAAGRHVPHYPDSVLNGCGKDEIASIGHGIASAIDSGAPLYNAGNVEACYRIYEGAISDLQRKLKGCPAAKQVLQQGLETADQRADWSAKAWALRDTFDGMIEVIDRDAARR